MKVYLVQSPKDDGGTLNEVFSREGAIKLARKAGLQYGEDKRTDEQCLQDFITVHWAQELELLNG